MALTLYNTLTRKKEAFEPIDPANVRMYVCGPTVYDYAHIGNARPVVVFDTLYRLLRHVYGADHVTYVRNITDVDDKIIAAQRQTGEPIEAITRRFADAYNADMAALNALPPDVEPRATAHIPQMIAMMEKLVASSHAYAADGHVLFHVPSMPGYGALSRHSRDALIAGARVEVAPYKKDPADFVLWKPSADDQPGWDSPWGRGRPGWHLECSAMSEAHLGETFDIHGGGQDLIFPHHENEIAQSVCAHGGAPFVRYWMHNGYLTVNGEKMSKSLGNFHTVRELLDEGIPGEAIRLALLSAHYRQPLDFSKQALAEAKTRLDRWYRVLLLAETERSNSEYGEPDRRYEYPVPNDVLRLIEDDLNTPSCLPALDFIADQAFRAANAGDQVDLFQYAGDLRASGQLLGLLQQDPEDWFKGGSAGGDGPSAEEVEDMIRQRAEARKQKDFAEADRIRDALADSGVVLEDAAGGTTWKRSR